MTYGYNPDSLPATVSYATGATPGSTRTYAYNGLGQLTSGTLITPGGAAIASAAYGYDADRNLSTQATTGLAGAGTTSYGYNKASQLTSATTGGTTHQLWLWGANTVPARCQPDASGMGHAHPNAPGAVGAPGGITTADSRHRNRPPRWGLFFHPQKQTGTRQ